MSHAPALVCSPAVTVLAGLVHDDGVALVADRATVNPFAELSPGMPLPGQATIKLFASGAGVVAGITGTAVVPGVNLLDVVNDIVASSASAAAAHPSLLAACDEAAPALREHQSVAAKVTTFEQPVLTVVLLGGVGSPAGPQLVAYGIPETGPTVFQSLQRSVVYAPSSVQTDAEHLALTDSPATPISQQVATWGGRLAVLAPLAIVRQRVDISAEWDAVVVSDAGSTGVVGHRG